MVGIGMNMQWEVKERKNKILQFDNIIIYGAHLIAEEIFNWLTRNKILESKIQFVVTKKEGNPDYIEGKPVQEMGAFKWSAIDRENTLILVCMPEKYHYQVWENLNKYKISSIVYLGLKTACELLADEMEEQFGTGINGFMVKRSGFDPTWLDLFHKKDKKKVEEYGINQVVHYKIPALTRFSKSGLERELRHMKIDEECKEICGPYINLYTLCKDIHEFQKTSLFDLLNIYMVMSHKDQIIQSKEALPQWIIPIQAGGALTDIKKAEVGDNQGENISIKNDDYAEMTAMYWIWKNSRNSIYKGLCHYRRHFVLNKQEIFCMNDAGIDALLTTPRLVLNGLKDMFIKDTPVRSNIFDNMLKGIAEIHPETLQKAEAFFEGRFYYPNNMVIAREAVFNDYCQWIFPVLFYMETEVMKKQLVKEKRYIAFASELLTSLYFVIHKEDYKIAVADYKFYE